MSAISTISTQPRTILPSINAREINGVLHFVVDRGNNCQEYWKTDGTRNGTVFVAKI